MGQIVRFLDLLRNAVNLVGAELFADFRQRLFEPERVEAVDLEGSDICSLTVWVEGKRIAEISVSFVEGVHRAQIMSGRGVRVLAIPEHEVYVSLRPPSFSLGLIPILAGERDRIYDKMAELLGLPSQLLKDVRSWVDSDADMLKPLLRTEKNDYDYGSGLYMSFRKASGRGVVEVRYYIVRPAVEHAYTLRGGRVEEGADKELLSWLLGNVLGEDSFARAIVYSHAVSRLLS